MSLAGIKAWFQANPWAMWLGIGGAGVGVLYVLHANGSQSSANAAQASAPSAADMAGDPSLTSGGDSADPSGAAPSWFDTPPPWYTNPPPNNDGSGTPSPQHPPVDQPVSHPGAKHPVTKHPAKKTITKKAATGASNSDGAFNRKNHMDVQGVEEHAGDFSTGAATHASSLDLPTAHTVTLAEHSPTRSIAPAPSRAAHPAESEHAKPLAKKPAAKKTRTF